MVAIANLAQAQKQVTIEGRITRKSDNRSVKGAHINVAEKEGQGTTSDQKGFYSLTVSYKKPFKLLYSDIRFINQEVLFDASKLRRASNDTIRLNIAMEDTVYTFPTLEISGKPDTVFGSPRISVEDYEFYGDKYVILVYEKTLRKGSRLILADADQKVLSSFTIPKQAKELYKDFQGNINVLCENGVYLVDVYKDQISLSPREEEAFNNQIKPVIDTTEGKVYFSNFQTDYPAFDYYSWAAGDSLPEHMKFIVDEPLMELFRSEFKYLETRQKLEAVRLGLTYGIDKEVAAAFISGFANSIYYEPLYAPLFTVDDTIVIFDHYNHYLYRFNANDELLDSASITYHKTRKLSEWRQQMIQDEKEERIYALFLKHGYHYLKEINIYTGAVDRIFKFAYKYADRIQIKGDYVYYVYRPYGSMQKKFLYKEPIR